MDSGYYAACSGLLARVQALDVTANNLANVSTAGYKSENEFYGALDASLSQPAPSDQLNQAVNRFGILGGDYINMREGSLDPTGNPLDVAVEGPGLFVVQTPSGIRFTRAGNFHLNTKGQLVTSDGSPVMGLGGPIKLPGIGQIGPIDASPGHDCDQRGWHGVGERLAGRASQHCRNEGRHAADARRRVVLLGSRRQRRARNKVRKCNRASSKPRT